MKNQRLWSMNAFWCYNIHSRCMGNHTSLDMRKHVHSFRYHDICFGADLFFKTCDDWRETLMRVRCFVMWFTTLATMVHIFNNKDGTFELQTVTSTSGTGIWHRNIFSDTRIQLLSPLRRSRNTCATSPCATNYLLLACLFHCWAQFFENMW